MLINTPQWLVLLALGLSCLHRPAFAQTEPQDATASEADAIRKDVIAAWTKRQQASSSFQLTYLKTETTTPEGLAYASLDDVAQFEFMKSAIEAPGKVKLPVPNGAKARVHYKTIQLTLHGELMRREYWRYANAEEQDAAAHHLTPGEGSHDVFVSNGLESSTVCIRRRTRDSKESYRRLSQFVGEGYDVSSLDNKILFWIARGMLPEVQQQFPLESAIIYKIPKSPVRGEQILARYVRFESSRIHELTLDRSRGYLPVEYVSFTKQTGEPSLIVNIDYSDDVEMPIAPSGWTTSWMLADGTVRMKEEVRVIEAGLEHASVTPETFTIPILEGMEVINARIDGTTNYSIMHNGKLWPLKRRETYWEGLERIKRESESEHGSDTHGQ